MSSSSTSSRKPAPATTPFSNTSSCSRSNSSPIRSSSAPRRGRSGSGTGSTEALTGAAGGLTELEVEAAPLLLGAAGGAGIDESNGGGKGFGGGDTGAASLPGRGGRLEVTSGASMPKNGKPSTGVPRQSFQESVPSGGRGAGPSNARSNTARRTSCPEGPAASSERTR